MKREECTGLKDEKREVEKMIFNFQYSIDRAIQQIVNFALLNPDGDPNNEVFK